jgi:hypothetical protein
VSTPAINIFSLGSVFYTGHWPYKPPSAFEAAQDKFDYQRKVNTLFSQGQFPDMTRLMGGKVVMGCWIREYRTVEDVLLSSRFQAVCTDVIEHVVAAILSTS